MNILLDDYNRRLVSINDAIIEQKLKGDKAEEERLRIIANQYRSFIADIEKAIKREKEI